jgi:arylsulfatase A-like enzyme
MRATLVLLVCAGAFACADPPAGDPDVILVTLDTTRADHLGLYGYPRDVSPSLDSFSRDAVIFARAWASGAWTLPTHASMLTGRHASSHGARFSRADDVVALSEVLQGEFFEKHKASRLPEDEVTLAELLAKRGHATAVFAGGPWLAPPFGLLQGYQLQDAIVTEVSGRSAQELTDRMIAWMETLPADQPLHALINYFDPHSPYEPPPGFDGFPGAKLPLDPGQDEILVNGGREFTAKQRKAVIGRYDGEIRYMDYHFGRLLAALKQAGRYENALIIVVADHGELIGEHDVLGHGRWLYEPVLRIPLIIRFPGGKGGGSVSEELVSQVDLLPLVAAELGFELPRRVDGVPLGTRTRVFAEAFRDPFSTKAYGDRYDRDLVALVRWPLKLIASDLGGREIYDLTQDPAEMRNQTGPASAASLVVDLAEVVAALEVRESVVPPSEVSPELREGLRALGYIE